MTEDPSSEDIDIDVAPLERTRPGPQHASLWAWLVLLAVGLLPVAAVPFALLPISQRAGRLDQQLGEQVAAVRHGAERLAGQLQQSEQRARQLQQELAKVRFERDYRRALDTLVERLGTLVAGQTAEQLAQLKPVREALKAGPDPFLEAALLSVPDRRVIATRSGKGPGALDELLPELAARWAPDRPSPGALQDWSWQPLGNSGFLVAVKSRPPTAATEATPPPAPIAEPPVLSGLADLFDSLSTSAWALSLALPLFAIGLSLIALWWFRQKLLAPLVALSRAAQQVLEDPGTAPMPEPEAVGLMRDLATSLLRLDQRMRRLAAQDEQAIRDQRDLLALKTAVDRAATGRLGLRAPAEEGPHQELALAINRLLDMVVERIEGFHLLTRQLRSAAERLRPIAQRLQGRLLQASGPAPLPDPSGLGELLAIQVTGLCDTVDQLGGGLQRGAPEALEDEELARFRDAVRTTGDGFQLLQERISEASGASHRLAALRQEAEVLSTNLAISVEARSPAQLERLVDDARALSRVVVDLSEGLVKSLGQLAAAGEGLREAFQESNVHFQQAVRQLAQWEVLRRGLGQISHELQHRAGLLRPGVSTLGADLRALGAALGTSRELQTRLAETLAAAGQASGAVADTAEALLQQLDQIDTGRPAPAGVTRRLARHQRELERAVLELGELATSEGIEVLTADTRDILDRIQTLAESARARLQARTESPPEVSRAEPDS